MNTPLILTVRLDEKSQSYFDEKRKQYFPPERNLLSAHLTLFHHLPDNDTTIITTLEKEAKAQKILLLNVTEVVSLGKGVAYKMESPALLSLHKRLQKEWTPFLTPQDRQGLWPHVTIQNKVSAAEAKQTRQQLAGTFSPFRAQATGLSIWRYLNGPWQWYRSFEFAG